jgi:hypothetical protein
MKQQKKKEIIPFRQTLFWDVDPATIDPEKHAKYIIERIMDFGNDQEARWIYKRYPRSILHDVIKHSRSLHPQSRVLWEALTK